MPAEEADIQLFNQTSCSLPVSEAQIRQIASVLSQHENCSFLLLEVVFVDEEEIVRINKEYLGHRYITDIITFRYDKKDYNSGIEGTLYCCAPRIKEQALEYDVPAENEFRRIVIHGLLHLIGYDDQSERAQRQMTEKEDFYLNLS